MILLRCSGLVRITTHFINDPTLNLLHLLNFHLQITNLPLLDYLCDYHVMICLINPNDDLILLPHHHHLILLYVRQFTMELFKFSLDQCLPQFN